MPSDLEGLAQLDVASTSNTVLDVVSTEDGFAFRERTLPVPTVKNHEFLAEVTAAERAWTDGYVAVAGTCLLGFAATGLQRWNRRQVLWHLYVDRAHRGRGHGRALVERVVRLGRDNRARCLWLETQNTNVPSVRAYQAMGFDLVGLDRTLYDGDVAHETALYLAKAL